MKVMVLDSKGRAATFDVDSVSSHLLRNCVGIKVLASVLGEFATIARVPPQGMTFPVYAPVAQPIRACTKFGASIFGKDAIVWEIGLEADNGFSAPPREVVDSCYVQVRSAPKHLEYPYMYK